MWINEKEHIHAEDALMMGFTFDDLLLMLENENPEKYKPGTPKKSIVRNVLKRMIRDRCEYAKELVEANLDTIINLAFPEKVVDGKVKTKRGWEDSDTPNFQSYVKENDLVALDMVEHFRDCVLPAYMSNSMVQCGEPHSFARDENGKCAQRYLTFIYMRESEEFGEIWKYVGPCFLGTTEKGSER